MDKIYRVLQKKTILPIREGQLVTSDDATEIKDAERAWKDVQEFGKPGFRDILYQGEKLHLEPSLTEYASVLYFDHMYAGTFNSMEPTKKVHICLRCGYFCFENFVEKPIDIFAYLYIKFLYLKRKLNKPSSGERTTHGIIER